MALLGKGSLRSKVPDLLIADPFQPKKYVPAPLWGFKGHSPCCAMGYGVPMKVHIEYCKT